MLDGDQCGHRATVRPADKMHGAQIQRPNERREIGSMSHDREVLAVVRPRFGAEVALRVCDVAVFLGEGGPLQLPGTPVTDRAVDKNDWRALTLFDVGQVDAVDFSMLRLGLGSTGWLHGLARDKSEREQTAEQSAE